MGSPVSMDRWAKRVYMYQGIHCPLESFQWRRRRTLLRLPGLAMLLGLLGHGGCRRRHYEEQESATEIQDALEWRRGYFVSAVSLAHVMNRASGCAQGRYAGCRRLKAGTFARVRRLA
jgi:hypothetical protein